MPSRASDVRTEYQPWTWSPRTYTSSYSDSGVGNGEASANATAASTRARACSSIAARSCASMTSSRPAAHRTRGSGRALATPRPLPWSNPGVPIECPERYVTASTARPALLAYLLQRRRDDGACRARPSRRSARPARRGSRPCAAGPSQLHRAGGRDPSGTEFLVTMNTTAAAATPPGSASASTSPWTNHHRTCSVATFPPRPDHHSPSTNPPLRSTSSTTIPSPPMNNAPDRTCASSRTSPRAASMRPEQLHHHILP